MNLKHERWIAAREAGATQAQAARAALPGDKEGSPNLARWAENGDQYTGYKPKVEPKPKPKPKPKAKAKQVKEPDE